jgi:hypothetical protein
LKNIRPVSVINNINFIFSTELAFETVKLPFGYVYKYSICPRKKIKRIKACNSRKNIMVEKLVIYITANSYFGD